MGGKGSRKGPGLRVGAVTPLHHDAHHVPRRSPSHAVELNVGFLLAILLSSS